MCSIKDAKRNEELARLQLKEGEMDEARESYLEAASIYVLNAQTQSKEELVEEANRCYKLSREAIGESWNERLTKQQLAQRTIDELGDKKENRLTVLNEVISDV